MVRKCATLPTYACVYAHTCVCKSYTYKCGSCVHLCTYTLRVSRKRTSDRTPRWQAAREPALAMRHVLVMGNATNLNFPRKKRQKPAATVKTSRADRTCVQCYDFTCREADLGLPQSLPDDVTRVGSFMPGCLFDE